MTDQSRQRVNTQRILVLFAFIVGVFSIGAVVALSSLASSAEASVSSSMQWQDQQDDSTPPPPTEVVDDSGITLLPSVTMEPFFQSDLKILSGNVQRPNGLFWHGDFLYTGCAGDFTLYRIHDTTGETITYAAGVQNTHTLYVEDKPDGDVDLFVADFQRNTLANIQDGPKVVNLAENLQSPWGVTADSEGAFLVTELRGDDVLRIQRDGTTEVVASGFRNPTGIAVDGDFVYVANNGSARRAIEWFDLSTYSGTAIPEEQLQPLIRGLQNPTNVVIGPDGLVYFAYSLGTRGIVGRVDPEVCRQDDGCTNADVEIVLWSELAAPLAGLTISDDMRLFVHTMFGSEIYWVQLPEDDSSAD